MKKLILCSILVLSGIINAAAQNYQWAKSIGSDDAGGNGILVSGLALDGNGNTFIAGWFKGTVDFDPGPGTANITGSSTDFDIYFAKYDASGNYLWAKTIGESMSDICFTLTTDAGGNIYIAGWYGGIIDFDPGAGTQNLAFAGSEDAFVAKYDNNGNYLWAIGVGGTGLETVYNMAVDGNGNVYVTGSFQDVVDFDPGAGVHTLTSTVAPGSSEIFFAKYDSNGNYVWANQLRIQTEAAYIAVDASGNPHLTGKFGGTVDFDPGAGTANLTGGSNNDIFFAKYTTAGNYVFAKGMGNSQTSGGNSIDVDGAGNIYVKGNFSSTIDFDPGAGTANLTSTWNDDIFIAKYDAGGNYIWAKNIPSGYVLFSGNSMRLDNNNDILLAGGFGGSVDFDPDSGVANLVAIGNTNIFFAKYDNNGNYLSAKSLIGVPFSGSSAYAIASHNNGDIFIAGLFRDTCDFDPGAGVTNLTTIQFYNDVFFARYTSGPASVNDNASPGNEIKAYPNPANNKITIEGFASIAQLQIIDVTGKVVYRQKTNTNIVQINTSEFISGLYLIRLTDSKGLDMGQSRFIISH